MAGYMAWKDSPFVNRLNDIILKMQSNGLLLHVKNNVQMELDLKLLKRPRLYEDNVVMFGMEELSIIFQAMAGAQVINFLIFVIEVYIGKKKWSKQV